MALPYLQQEHCYSLVVAILPRHLVKLQVHERLAPVLVQEQGPPLALLCPTLGIVGAGQVVVELVDETAALVGWHHRVSNFVAT